MDEQFDNEFRKLVSELNYICPSCYGHGRLFLLENLTGRKRRKKCVDCEGAGRVGAESMANTLRVGVEKVRKLRVLWAAANGMTLIERDSVERSGGEQG